MREAVRTWLGDRHVNYGDAMHFPAAGFVEVRPPRT